jgi:uroporphyrinogen decarboxylase
MPNESMTPRERWQAVLTRQTPDRVPMDYWSTPEFSAKLVRHLGLSRRTEAQLVGDFSGGKNGEAATAEAYTALREALTRMNVDFVVSVGPKYIGPPLPPNTDVFGLTYRSVDYGTGTYTEVASNPLAKFNSVEEIEQNYRWPDPDWYDYSVIPSQIAGMERYPIRGGGSEPFLTYKSLRGDMQAMMDLVENPEIVHYCLDKLFELAYIGTQRIYETIPGKVMITYVAEDMGGQDNLMFSKKHIRTFLLPRMKRIIDLAHQAGAFVFHHNDGNCRAILPDMIEAGIDVLNPIQWRSRGMEREGLKADFGERLVFHGAMDNQYTLPFGTTEEVRQEVRDNLAILGAGGGYILAPCHNIQPVSPPENIVAMYEEGYKCGWTG